MSEFKIKIVLGKNYNSCLELFTTFPTFEREVNNDNFSVFFWGDPIIEDDFDLNRISVSYILNVVYGHYYFLILDKQLNSVIVGNSLFSILPLFYTISNTEIEISNKPSLITKNNQLDKRFILENLLFNYPLFDNTSFIDVKLLPTNNFIKVFDSKVQFICHTDVASLFTDYPIAWRKSVNKLSDLFINSSKKYFSKNFSYTSLTGGFDGRTLTACGLYHGIELGCYCFGSDESKDVKIAEDLCSKSGVKFIKIKLDQEYVDMHSLKYGLSCINYSNGYSTFSRAHYLYAVEKLFGKCNEIITGNFGSEIFRAAHLSGAVISDNLHAIFAAENFSNAIKYIKCSDRWRYIDIAKYSNEWDELVEDIRKMPCFNENHKVFSKNQQFYIFVFNEIFRKYFGTEIVCQFPRLKNRTPFLDINFVKEILNTELCGVYSEFFENNPFKRFKGQVLYSHIIRDTYPLFGKIKTDKGYRPNDLLSLKGNIDIAKAYYLKKVHRKFNSNEDPYSVNASFLHNKKYWLNIDFNDEIFDREQIIMDINSSTKRDECLLLTLSQAVNCSKIENEK